MYKHNASYALLCFFLLDVIVTFYHVTSEGNLESIAREGLQPSSRGKGISALKEETFFMDNSKGKVFLTTQWFTVKRYVYRALSSPPRTEGEKS